METIAWRCRSTTPEREVLAPPSMFVAEFSRTVRRRAYFGASAAHLDRGFGGVIDMLGRLSDSAASSSPASGRFVAMQQYSRPDHRENRRTGSKPKICRPQHPF